MLAPSNLVYAALSSRSLPSSIMDPSSLRTGREVDGLVEDWHSYPGGKLYMPGNRVVRRDGYCGLTGWKKKKGTDRSQYLPFFPYKGKMAKHEHLEFIESNALTIRSRRPP